MKKFGAVLKDLIVSGCVGALYVGVTVSVYTAVIVFAINVPAGEVLAAIGRALAGGTMTGFVFGFFSGISDRASGRGISSFRVASSARKRTLKLVAAPLTLYCLYVIIFVTPNWIWSFNSHHKSIPRYGYFAILRQSFNYSQGRNGYVRRTRCQSNLQWISRAFVMYTQDYDGRYPPVAVEKSDNFGWGDILEPYLWNAAMLQCPDEFMSLNSTNPRARDYTDYWYNSRVSKLNEKNLAAPTLTIVTGDGNDGSDLTDARYSLSSIPAKWRKDPNSPAYRHQGGAIYGFADGHIKWLIPSEVGMAPVSAGLPTFSPR